MIKADGGGSRSYHSTTYGINSGSPLLQLEGFDITRCLPFDIMHIVFKGVVTYHLNLLFGHLISSMQYFTLQQLNQCLKSHPYGYSEADTKPNHIRREAGAGSNYRVKQSGSYILLLDNIISIYFCPYNCTLFLAHRTCTFTHIYKNSFSKSNDDIGSPPSFYCWGVHQ